MAHLFASHENFLATSLASDHQYNESVHVLNLTMSLFFDIRTAWGLRLIADFPKVRFCLYQSDDSVARVASLIQVDFAASLFVFAIRLFFGLTCPFGRPKTYRTTFNWPTFSPTKAYKEHFHGPSLSWPICNQFCLNCDCRWVIGLFHSFHLFHLTDTPVTPRSFSSLERSVGFNRRILQVCLIFLPNKEPTSIWMGKNFVKSCTQITLW